MITSPTINLNGTSGKELLQQHLDARTAVLDAMRALQAAAPNGRDYQTVSPDVYKAARHQHNVWLGQLDDMAKELEEIAMNLSYQIG